MAQSKQSPQKNKAQGNQSLWLDKLPAWKINLIFIGILYIIVLFVFRGIVSDNMIFSDGGDAVAHEGWLRAMDHIESTEHVEPLWVPYIFSGMPVVGAMIFPRDVNYFQTFVVDPVGKVLFFGTKLSWMIMPFLLMGIFMFLIAREMKFSPWASLIAALTMMLSPYAMGLPETGHGSKLVVLGYIPCLFFMTYKLFQQRKLFWLGALGVVVATLLLCRHPQMGFYGLLVIGSYFLYEFILDIKQQPSVGIRKGLLFGGALLIGFTIYSYQFLPTQEYSQYSIRGGEGAGGLEGLNYEYATNWSFHPLETMNFILPSFMGIVPRPETQIESMAYWGWMPFTNSYVYIGIIPLFLGIIALVYRRNRMTWFLAILSLVVLFISFGKHFGVLYNLLFNYLPYFNKFRTPVMILHLMPFAFGILAAYGFTFFVEFLQQAKEPDILKLRKRLTTIVIVIGALLLVGLVFNDAVYSILSGSMFQKEGEMAQLRQQAGAQATQALAQIKKVRFDLFWKDYVKFALFLGGGIGLIIMYLKRKISVQLLAVGLALITLIDLVILDAKYINPKPATAVAERLQSDPTIQRLQAESDTSVFRIFPVGSLDQENLMMYHHVQSVEGYSPAKLKIYQEVRDSCFARGNRTVFNMLNVKYIVAQQQAQDGSVQTIVQPNPDYLPRTWFVDTAVIVSSKREAFSYLNSQTWNPRTTAILEKVPQAQFGKPDSSTVKLAKWESRNVTIDCYTAKPSLLVVSEIYYPAGWKAYIDGVETETYKTNYILRSVVVPQGSHVVEFRYASPAYALGYTLTQSAWGVTVLLLLIGGVQTPWLKTKLGMKKKEEPPAMTETLPQK
jgi:hypothetical protein